MIKPNHTVLEYLPKTCIMYELGYELTSLFLIKTYFMSFQSSREKPPDLSIDIHSCGKINAMELKAKVN